MRWISHPSVVRSCQVGVVILFAWAALAKLGQLEAFAAGWLALCLLHHPRRIEWTADRPPRGVSLLHEAGFAVVRDERRTIGHALGRARAVVVGVAAAGPGGVEPAERFERTSQGCLDSSSAVSAS